MSTKMQPHFADGIARQLGLDVGETAAVQRAGERVVRAHLDERRLERLPRGDVDENSMNECLAGVRVADEVAGVEHGSCLPSGRCRAISNSRTEPSASSSRTCSCRRSGSAYMPMAPTLPSSANDATPAISRNARIGVEDLTVAGGDVDALAQILGELAQALGIAQAAKTSGSGRRRRCRARGAAARRSAGETGFGLSWVDSSMSRRTRPRAAWLRP